jgi:hypothetical protein
MLLRQVGSGGVFGKRGPVVLGLVGIVAAVLLAAAPHGAAADPTDPPATPSADPTTPSAPAPTTTESAPSTPAPTPTGTPQQPPTPTGAPPTGAPTSTAPGTSTPAGPTAPPTGTTVPPPAAGSGTIPVVSARPAAVTMSGLTATNFVFKGTMGLRTPTGTLTVLVFHADRIVASDYRLRTTDAGPTANLSADLDISSVDIFATKLTGTVTVPILNLPLTDVTLTPDSVPAWLAVDLTLPVFTGTNLTVDQAYIQAGTVAGTHFSVTAPGR